MYSFVDVRRFQPTLKRSACRTVPLMCGVQVKVAGANRTMTELCLVIMLGVLGMCVGLLSFQWRGGRECVKAPRLFSFLTVVEIMTSTWLTEQCTSCPVCRVLRE